ncbi:hypothetical protein [Nitrosopumilus ureiphilus]|uniref:Uncharacterized protein n=1 Tax=Nitrosopumilus ureiphilus TaxID=1470067 RepID=A0A7D5R6A7_9ARCH|nr:hypothetical protein [Nitrosopumilus ureiphilus]QLH06777.1 hypothetical protein C5F50_06575 [Nitrosopumilus ureiphilus]
MKYFAILLILIGFTGIVFAEEIPIEIQTQNDINLIISGTILNYKDDQRISILIKNELDKPIFVSQLITNQTGYFSLNVTRQGILWDTAESFTVKAFRTSIHDEVTPLGLMKSNSTKIIAPLKQINLGLESYDVMCNSNLLLIQKYDGSSACVKEQTILKLINRGWTAESETKKLWKSTDDWNSLRLVRNTDDLYCNSVNEELFDQCYSLEEIVFGNGFKRGKHYGWKVYPSAGIILPKNSTLIPIYRTAEPLGFQQIDLNAMLDDKIFVNKCESNGGVWNYTYHDCEGIWEMCQDVNGVSVAMNIFLPCTGLCLDRGVYRLACVFEYEN